MGSVIVGLVLLVIVGLAVRSLVKSRKSGGCGCGCSDCPNSGACHPKQDE